MINLTQMRVQLNGQEQVLIQAAFVLTKIAPMAQIGDVRKNPLPRNILSRGFVSLRPLCANFELLRYQRCSMDTFFFFVLAECDICMAG